MGLSGIVTSVTLRLRPVTSGWMTVRTERTADLDHTIAALDAADHSTYSVAWVDSLAGGPGHGRGIVSSAEHTPASELSPAHARDPLGFAPAKGAPAPRGPLLVCSTGTRFEPSTRPTSTRRRGAARPRWATSTRPASSIRWTRCAVGTTSTVAHGFIQYQFLSADVEVVRWALARFAAARAPSFLTVLKRFGPGGQAPMSFPRTGWTLAVDLPTALPGLARLLDQLDARVAAVGRTGVPGQGRPAAAQSCSRSCTRSWITGARFAPQLDPRGVFVSDLSRRLSL